jgi:hypothetical protein
MIRSGVNRCGPLNVRVTAVTTEGEVGPGTVCSTTLLSGPGIPLELRNDPGVTASSIIGLKWNRPFDNCPVTDYNLEVMPHPPSCYSGADADQWVSLKTQVVSTS